MLRYFLLSSRTAPGNQNGHLSANKVREDGASAECEDDHRMNGILFGMRRFVRLRMLAYF